LKFSIGIIHIPINFNNFGDAESKSAIIFYVRTAWKPKVGPKNGIKFEVFDWINFRIFDDAETESAIAFHVRLIWVQNEAPNGGKIDSFWLHFNTFGDVKSESTIIFQVRRF